MKKISRAKYLITGGAGQLARAFCTLLDKANAKYIALDIDKLDISDIDELSKVCREYNPDFLINCAAYNNVDAAESEFETAMKVNYTGPKNIATLSVEHKFKAIHFSTDYVFGGRQLYIPFKEQDETAPLNKYGISKLKGEQIFLEISPKNLVFRVSWLYGEGRQNFIYKLLQWSQSRNEILIANDEISVPTSTYFVAMNALEALDANGLFHLVPDGYVSRYDYAKFVLNKLKVKSSIKPVPAEYFKLPARRPNFSAMDSTLFFSLVNREKKHWSEYLEEFLTNYKF
ncbi:MAG TPA: dTDP-4-dehydrorhamnose reductase [Candidatus Kapabacteria bacterium]|jgi:dTDP-4-dehydrorhamnose reductase|nr:dTDP-4-dehydrorhamnose reductase [Candidatus Kapabacteria bacterium]